MNFYENVLILDPNLDDKETEGVIGRVKDVIVKQGGEVLKIENWGCKKTAYEVKKNKKGLYMLLLFTAPPNTVAALEKLYRVFDPVLKFMVIKLKKKKQIKAALPEVGVNDSVEKEAGGTKISLEEEKENV